MTDIDHDGNPSELFAGDDTVPVGNALPEDELTDLDHAVIEAVWAVPYDELDESTQRRARKILGNQPEPLRDLLRGDHYTGEMIDDAFEHVFEGMQEHGFKEANIDGAAIFAKGVRKRLGLEE